MRNAAPLRCQVFSALVGLRRCHPKFYYLESNVSTSRQLCVLAVECMLRFLNLFTFVLKMPFILFQSITLIEILSQRFTVTFSCAFVPGHEIFL